MNINLFGFGVEIEINFVFVCGPKMIGIDWLGVCAGSRNWLSFGIRAETHLVLVWTLILTRFLLCVTGIDLILVWEIEPNLISVYRSKLAWFYLGVTNRLGYSVRDRNWLALSLGIWIDLFLCRVRINLVFVCGQEIIRLSCLGRDWLSRI